MGRKKSKGGSGGRKLLSSKDDEDQDFLFPLRWRKKCPQKKYEIADEDTLNNILTTSTAPRQPEFQGEKYMPEWIKSEDELVFQCTEPNCSSRFMTQAALQSHSIKHLNKKLRCSFCTMLFKVEEDRTKHLDEFHPDLDKTPEANPLQCKKCGRIPRDKQALWRHVRESHRGPPKPCPYCGILFNRVDNMKEHIKYKHPPDGKPAKRFSCETCGQQFTYKGAMRCHIRRAHRGNTTFHCVICDTTYSCKESYQNHMRHIHVNPRKTVPCVICNKMFRDRTHLKRHFKSHSHNAMVKKQLQLGWKVPFAALTEETGTEVENEKASFTNEELIESCRNKIVKIILHRVDERKSTYKFYGNPTPKRTDSHLNCVYCSDPLPNVESVAKHEAFCFMKIKGRKIHICPHCNKEFEKAFKLKVHMKTHSEERPFPCSYCDSKFKSRHLKVQHEKAVHFGIRQKYEPTRDYVCNYKGCGRKYSSGKSLQTHVTYYHIGVRLSCDNCRKEFKRKDQYRKHIKECQSDASDTTTLLLMCHPCKRTYKSKASMLMHLSTERHRRKSKELDKMSGNKKKKTDMIVEEHLPSSSPPTPIDSDLKAEEPYAHSQPSISVPFPSKDVKTEVEQPPRPSSTPTPTDSVDIKFEF